MKMKEEENSNIRAIEIPLKDTDEFIELCIDQLPEADEVLGILKGEDALLHIWISLAMEYYKQGKIPDFLKILECSRTQSTVVYKDLDKDKMRVLDILAAYYVHRANHEKNKDKKTDLITKARILYNDADKIIMYDQDHLIGRAYFSLMEGEIDHASTQFNFILNQSPDNIPALLGKANISYHKKDYRGALNYYKKAIQTNPKCPASVRVGIAHCFLKLNNEKKAKMAFERALQLDPNCIGALIGLGIMTGNENGPENLQKGLSQISHAWNIDPSDPMVLNHLSNHYFFKKDCKKVQQFALNAFHSTENESMRAESCYHLAKSYHIQKDYDQAFQYYYQSTQCAPPNFVLPHYGLGQMYLHRGDTENAILCFEKVLKTVPDNYEAMKILSYLYANSGCPEKVELAREYLQKLTERFSDDIEAWIEYAQILETNHCATALIAYKTALKLLKDLSDMIPPEILNNLGVCHYRLGNISECQFFFDQSLIFADRFSEIDLDYYTGVSVTVTYNLARVQESLGHFDRAECLYKQISKEFPKYIDCYVRLGCMARAKGQISEASDWFREVIKFNTEDPDGWSLMANLFMDQTAYGAAQKKFEKILTFEGSKEDHYAVVALGNIWLETLHQNLPQERRVLHENRALACFKQVLRWEPKNIWAANGIGAVLANKGYLIEARQIFGDVREATSEFCDVWLNIAHIYIEQGQYMSAIHMYENCIKKFYKRYDVELQQYLARAYFKAGKFEESRVALLRARRVAPLDKTLLFNIALTLQYIAVSILEDEMSDLARVLKATENLKLSLKFFKYLSESDKIGFGARLVTLAQCEVQKCSDLIAQTGYHIARAKTVNEEEKIRLKKQEQDRQEMVRRQREEEKKLEEERKRIEEENKKKRQLCVEKVKNIILAEKIELENSEEKKCKTEGDSGTELMEEEKCEVKVNSKRGRPRKKKSTNEEPVFKQVKKIRMEDRRKKVHKIVENLENEDFQNLVNDEAPNCELKKEEVFEKLTKQDEISEKPTEEKMEIEVERLILEPEETSPRRSRSRSRSLSGSDESALSRDKSGSSRSASVESQKSTSSILSQKIFQVQSVKPENALAESFKTR